MELKSFTYLTIDLACISVPFIASFYKKHAFIKHFKSFVFSNLLVGIPFIIWDIIFTQHGVWGFNPDYLIGINIFNLPIEEVLFFICIPYACVFTYFAIQYLLPQISKLKIERPLWVVFFAICMGFIWFGKDQLYTFYTGLFTAIFLLVLKVRKVEMNFAYVAYFLILPFFFLSNGILTGSFLASPIVWYNNQENFAVRMFTIPVEDSIYGFLLVVGNMVLFEFFKKKSLKKP